MSIAPLPDRRGLAPRLLSPRLLSETVPRGRRPLTRAAISRRRWLVTASKYMLPLLAVALLGSIALWPELTRILDQQRLGGGRIGLSDTGQAEVKDARYRGIDEKGQPYTITAVTARQISADRVDLTTLKGDVTLQSGSWLLLQADRGVYTQRADQLDLEGRVVVYRDDGTTLHTPSATVDMKLGAATGAERVHAEGPFGTLDAQGFALTDKGDVIQFTGPGHMVLNGSNK